MARDDREYATGQGLNNAPVERAHDNENSRHLM